MFEVFYEFIADERAKSSTRVMKNVIDEWEQVFAKDVNLILLKCFMRFVVQANGKCVDKIECDMEMKNKVLTKFYSRLLAAASDNRQEFFLKILSHSMNRFDFKYVEVAHRIDSKTSVDDLMQFALNNLSHEYHTIRMASATIIKQMSKYLIKTDSEQLTKRQEKQTTIVETTDLTQWHLLHRFRDVLISQNEWTQKYMEEFK